MREKGAGADSWARAKSTRGRVSPSEQKGEATSQKPKSETEGRRRGGRAWGGSSQSNLGAGPGLSFPMSTLLLGIPFAA